MTDPFSSAHPAAASSDERNLAILGYALLFVSPFVAGLSALATVILAYVRRHGAEPLARSHYDFQIRIFWIGVVLSLISAVAFLFGLGVLLNDVVRAVTNNGRTWDSWDIAAIDESNFTFHVGSLLGFASWFIVSGLTALVVLGTTVFGLARLSMRLPIGRAATA